jgi:hypothetical protein
MKQYRLAPITETAEQATETESQKGKIAKQILLGIDAHLNGYQVARKIDAGGIQPVQSFKLEKLLLFACNNWSWQKRFTRFTKLGPWAMSFTASSRSWGLRQWSAPPNAWKQAPSASTIKLMPVN